ncbi:hypothetical protein [Sphingobium yanoikuyae]|uniref:hypothetical protein n=1 Tax=Sphingobium yanoikuyae TaxID=13690 RepID=UPI000262C03E|nr:hypothetical protein [Sphingobium yanoikuyae]
MNKLAIIAAVAGFVAGRIQFVQHGHVPTLPEPEVDHDVVAFSTGDMRDGDPELVERNLQSIMLSNAFGCDIAISRDGGRAQWLADGGEPDRGSFLVVRREDRV